MTDRQRELYIKTMLGFGTTVIYFIIISILVVNNVTEHVNPEYALYILAIGGVINIIASIIVIRYGSINDKDISWHITRLAVAHVPTLLALFGAILYLFF